MESPKEDVMDVVGALTNTVCTVLLELLQMTDGTA